MVRIFCFLLLLVICWLWHCNEIPLIRLRLEVLILHHLNMGKMRCVGQWKQCNMGTSTVLLRLIAHFRCILKIETRKKLRSQCFQIEFSNVFLRMRVPARGIRESDHIPRLNWIHHPTAPPLQLAFSASTCTSTRKTQ